MKAPRSAAETLICRVTPSGTGGIAVVELHGPAAAQILAATFSGTIPKPGRIAYGKLRSPEEETLDEVLLETVNETHYAINGHGGEAACRALLDLFVAHGAVERPVEVAALGSQPCDAIEREALRVLPQARSRRAAFMLLAQAEGALSERIRRAAASLTLAVLDDLITTADGGIRLVNPPRVLLAGRPNAGKSSLANAFHHRDRSIVTAEAGTTLDPVEELALIEDYPVLLVDTAGTGLARHALDEQADAAARQASKSADLILHVIDLSTTSSQDEKIFSTAPVLTVWSKRDLVKKPPRNEEAIVVSCKTGEGLDVLGGAIIDVLFSGLPVDPAVGIVFTREQKDAILKARAALIEGRCEEAEQHLQELLR